MPKTPLIAAIVAGVAAVAVAASMLVWFFPQEQGTYSGTGTPQTVVGMCGLGGEAHWCARGFEVNSTNFNMSMCYTTNTIAKGTAWAYFMNTNSYDSFSVNSTLTYIAGVPTPQCVGPTTYGLGPGAFYWVWVDSARPPVQVQYSISVEALP
jgi:hypothetical protein